MANLISIDTLKKVNFFRGLDDAELGMVSALCKEKTYQVGEICQIEGQSDSQVHIIIRGRVGAVAHIPNISCNASEIILDTLGPGEVFGWSALIRGTPWSTLRVLESTDIFFFSGEDLMDLCENNNHIGYVMMKNLAMLIAVRLRRNRMSTLNAIVAMKGI
jgi:CRP/FNR family transcriptional regulator, cyclic AMP receptor protein